MWSNELNKFSANDVKSNSPNNQNANQSDSLSPISDSPLSSKIQQSIPTLTNAQNVLAKMLQIGAQKPINSFLESINQSDSSTQPLSIESILLANALNLDKTEDNQKTLKLINSLGSFGHSNEISEGPLDLSTKTPQNLSPEVKFNSDEDLTNSRNTNFIRSFNTISPSILFNPDQLNNAYRSFSNSTTTSSTPNGRRNRTSITALQSRCMHLVYNFHKTPSVHECDKIGDTIGLTRRVVQVWFQNQRAKEKKMARVNFAHLTNESSNPMSHEDNSCMNAHFCYICSVSICNYDGVQASSTLAQHQLSSANSSTTARVPHLIVSPLNQTNFTSNAPFVDHLFSSTHLKNLLKWCSIDSH